jgi:hypothetical protein
MRKETDNYRQAPDYKTRQHEYNSRPEVKERKRLWRLNNKYKLRERAIIRRKVRTAIESKRIIKLPCSICGNPLSEAHHEDYSKPLEITWLCRHHHSMRDKEIKRSQADDAMRTAAKDATVEEANGDDNS